MSAAAQVCRFDWYEVTFDGGNDSVVAYALAAETQGQLSPARGRYGYTSAHHIERKDADGTAVVLATVFGKSARPGEVHVTVSGACCDELVPILRRLYPDHRVSRADSAVDLRAEFADLDARALQLATDRGLSHRLITDSSGGATRYLGAPSSELRVRVYRKSEQLRALHPETADTVPDGIVRAELQARPSKRAIKQAVSTMTPDDLWGLGQWSKGLALDLLGFEAERVPTHSRRPSDWERTLHYFAKQYRPSILRRAQSVGLDQAVSELLDVLTLEEV